MPRGQKIEAFVGQVRELRALAPTTTPQIKNVIGRVRKNKRAARAECTFSPCRPRKKKQQREIAIFTVLMKT